VKKKRNKERWEYRRRVKAIGKTAAKLNLLEEVWYGIPELDEEDGTPTPNEEPMPEFSTLIEQVIERENMLRAYRRVVRNKGSAGVDGVGVKELGQQVEQRWPEIKEQLLKGQYQPQAVRAVAIPKAKGGMRQLGIPTVMDRLIQQALTQVISSLFEPDFSESSYGFRPKRNAHMAVTQAKGYQRSGKRWVVDLDLERFFDEVHHDRLMKRIAWKVKDALVLKLIHRYLRSGILVGGVESQRRKGTPQGSPLSPLLSNIVLDELDKELERRKLSCCRYADDCVIYVRSKKAAERVRASIGEFIKRRMKLKVNEEKSRVVRPWNSTFLGYTYMRVQDAKVRVPKESIQRFKGKLKRIFREGRGRNLQRFIKERLMPVIRGWVSYFRLSEVRAFAENLDEWIRRRLRLIIWKQWRRPRTRRARLVSRGLGEERASKSAYNGRGSWWNAGASHMNQAIPIRYLRSCGLVPLVDLWKKYNSK